MGITEGPWEIDCDDMEVWVKSSNGEMICQLEWNLPRHGNGSLTNARAISALPEIVASLQTLERYCTEHASKVGSMHAWWDGIFEARSALTKAGLF